MTGPVEPPSRPVPATAAQGTRAADPTPGAAPATGWRRPVRLRDAAWVLTLATLAWLTATVLVLRAVHARLQDPAAAAWQARVTLRDLPVRFVLPDGVRAEAETPHRVAAELRLHPWVEVPIAQTLAVQLAPDAADGGGRLSARARLETVVAVDTRFRFQQTVAVSTELDAQVRLLSWLPPVAVKVPVQLQVPVDAEVPVQARVPVQIDAPVQVRLDEPLQVPLHATLRLHPRVQARLDVDVRGRTGFRLLGPVPPVQARVDEARLRIDRGDVRLELHGASEPASSVSGAAR